MLTRRFVLLPWPAQFRLLLRDPDLLPFDFLIGNDQLTGDLSVRTLQFSFSLLQGRLSGFSVEKTILRTRCS
jgi:hypothetical protein